MSNVGWALVALGVALVFSFYVVLSHSRDRGRWRTFVLFETVCLVLATVLILRASGPMNGTSDVFAGLFFIMTVSVWAVGTLVLGMSAIARTKRERK